MRGLLLLFTIFCLIRATDTFGQFKRGTLMVGPTIGTAAYSSANSDYAYDNGQAKTIDTKTYSLTMGPQIGVFISPYVVVGGTFSFSLNSSQANSTISNTDNTTSGSKTTTTTSTVNLGPFLRYYFAGLPAKNWIYMQINGAAGTGSGTNSGSSYTSTTTTTLNGSVSNIINWNAGGSLGMTHFFYKHIGMDMALGYNYSHAQNYDVNNVNTTNDATGKLTSTTNNYKLNIGTNGITLGVAFHWFL